jgi:replication factor C subunit 2/4
MLKRESTLLSTLLREICDRLVNYSEWLTLLFQALNNLQCTASGYGVITPENVYKVCDEPHPDEISEFFEKCVQGEFHNAFAYLDQQRKDGHAFTDMLAVLHRNLIYADIPEILKYEFIKVSWTFLIFSAF